jgi:hypothetical protein
MPPVVSETGQLTLTHNRAGIMHYAEGEQYTAISIPLHAVTRTTTLSYTALLTPSQVLTPGQVLTPSYVLTSGVVYAGRSFRLDVFQDGTRQPGFVFAQPICVTLEYTPTGLADLTRRPLRLYHLDGDTWRDAVVGRCEPPTLPADVQPLTSMAVRASQEFALAQGPPLNLVYLPIMQR